MTTCWGIVVSTSRFGTAFRRSCGKVAVPCGPLWWRLLPAPVHFWSSTAKAHVYMWVLLCFIGGKVIIPCGSLPLLLLTLPPSWALPATSGFDVALSASPLLLRPSPWRGCLFSTVVAQS